MIISDLKIHKIPKNSSNKNLKMKGDWIFIELFADNNISGMGEASYSGNDNQCWKRIQFYHEKYFYHNELNPDFLSDIKSSLFTSINNFVDQTALSALLMACEELLAKSERKTVGEWWAQSSLHKLQVPVYATINRALMNRTPKDFVQAALSAVNDGFQIIKCAPFDEVMPQMTSLEKQQSAQKGLDRLNAIKTNLPENVEFMIDCHGRFDLKSSLWLFKTLEPMNLFWIEEPLPENERIESLAELKNRMHQRIALGETLFASHGFAPLIESGFVDVIMPDVKHVGGFTELLYVTEYAAKFGVGIAPHNMSGPISTAASIQCGLVSENCNLIEYPWGEMADRQCEPPESIVDGNISPGTDIGWGIKMRLST